MQLKLTVESGPSSGKSCTVAPGQTLVVGRVEQAGWILRDDPLLSNLHFSLEWDGDEWKVRDLKTKFGTQVNKVPITEKALKDGDQVKAGQTLFGVRLIGVTMTAPAPEPGVANDLGLAGPPLGAQPGKADPLAVLRRQDDPLFVVLDAAREPPAVLALLLNCKLENQSLYEGAKGEALALYGPYLISVPKNSEFLEALVRDGWGRSWGFFLTSPHPFAEVRKHLRRFLEVKLPDGKQVYFRYYDPRVLRVYLPSCTPEEWQTFAGPVTNYFMEGDKPNVLLHYSAAAPAPNPLAVNV